MSQPDSDHWQKPEKSSLTDESDLAVEQKLDDKPTFPEGGLQAWLTVLGACLLQYCTFGYTNAFGVYEDYYARIYLTNYTASEIGWIGGTQIFLVFSLGIFTGRAADRGYFRHLVLAGSILHALALFMLSLSHENEYYQVFLAQGICHGLSSGLCYTPSLAIVSHYFHKRRPLAMGIVSAGSALGAVLHPIMLNKLFHNSIGFHNGVRVSAGLNTFLLVIANLIMRTRLPPKKEGSNIPIADFARDPPYVFVVLAGMLMFFGVFFPVFYLQLNAVSHGIDEDFAFYSLSILNAASVFGRTVPSIFAAKLGVFNLLTFFTAGSGVVILCMAAIKDVAGVVVFAIFYGFFSGGAISLSGPTLVALSRNVNEVGARLGVVFFFAGFIGLFATPIAGTLLTQQYHWIRGILFSGITMIAAGCSFAVARFMMVKRRGSQFV